MPGVCAAEKTSCCESGSAAHVRPNSRYVETLRSSNSVGSGLAAPLSRGRAFLPRRLLAFHQIALLIFFAAPLIAGQSHLGKIDFPNSGTPEAQEPFTRGVLLLHSFEYEDAREAFQEARTIDPDFALAWWGEAMTHNHPLWRHQDREAARDALSRFAPTLEQRLERTPTERERDYLRAIEILYGDGEKIERDLAYSEGMGALAARYPDDLEARAFYSLSILGTVQGVRDFRTYMRAGAVAEEVFAANPRHPGAAHYMIHSYDDPIHAPLGVRAARVYALIAPAASHAQHMISHIWVALGDWLRSIEANRKAVDVSIERRKRKELGPDAVSYHALHWLEYSLLQAGRFEEARETMEMMTRYAEESGSETALWHHAAMRANWIVETEDANSFPEMRTGETALSGAAASLFATGFVAIRNGDRETAVDAAERLANRHETAVAHHGCGVPQRYRDPSPQEITAAAVMYKSLLGLIELDRGEPARALALLEEATALEESMPLDYGPPAIVKPSHELYGEVLLKLDRKDAAAAQFEKALERNPNRRLSLAGLAKAVEGEAVPAELP
ncbi:MAG: hypothetical protein KY432_05605 [Acidobacteria bacterium]|nr:hypothetical protein [Acidobacteriota bacterium]